MKLKITQTIIEVEWPDEQRQATPWSSPLPSKPDRLHHRTQKYEIDEDAYSRVIEMWETEGGYV